MADIVFLLFSLRIDECQMNVLNNTPSYAVTLKIALFYVTSQTLGHLSEIRRLTTWRQQRRLRKIIFACRREAPVLVPVNYLPQVISLNIL